MLFSSVAEGQILDTIRTAYKGGSRVIGGLSGRSSILSGEPVRIYELFGGLDYSDVFRIYWGFSFMPEPISEVIVYDQFTAIADTVNTKSNISYLTFAGEYSFYRKDRWKLSVPVQLGFGINQIRQYDMNGAPYRFNDKMIVPLETGVNAVYYFNRWLGAKAGIGIRFVGGDEVLADLSGPYYNLGIAVFFGEIYRMVFKE